MCWIQFHASATLFFIFNMLTYHNSYLMLLLCCYYTYQIYIYCSHQYLFNIYVSLCFSYFTAARHLRHCCQAVDCAMYIYSVCIKFVWFQQKWISTEWVEWAETAYFCIYYVEWLLCQDSWPRNIKFAWKLFLFSALIDQLVVVRNVAFGTNISVSFAVLFWNSHQTNYHPTGSVFYIYRFFHLYGLLSHWIVSIWIARTERA